MKIDPISLAYIQNVVKTANLAKIENIIIEPGKVRAIDDDRTVILFHTKDVPDMPFGSIGLNRIDTFLSRFDVVKSISNFELDAVVDESAPNAAFVRSLTLKGKGIKVDYRCANPLTIQAPKNINDKVKYGATMTTDTMSIMQKGQTAMSAEEVTFIGSDDGISIEITDVNSDALTYKFTETVECVDVEDESLPNFRHKYPIKTVLALFKNNPECSFYFTSKGILKVINNSLDMYILPRT